MADKSFRFPLERVLSVRRHEVEAARRCLTCRIQDRRRQEARLAEMRERLAALEATSREEPVGLAVLQQNYAFRQEAWHAVEAARRTLEDLQRLEEEARQELLAKRQAEEALQTLADQARTQHRRKQEAAAASFLDEQALASFRRDRASRKPTSTKAAKKRAI